MCGKEVRQVALGDQAIDFSFVVAELGAVCSLLRRDDAVVRRDLFVVPRRRLDRAVTFRDEARQGRHGFGDCGEHVLGVGVLRLGKERAIRAWVARRLVRFVKGLAQIERLLRGKAKLVRGAQLNVGK